MSRETDTNLKFEETSRRVKAALRAMTLKRNVFPRQPLPTPVHIVTQTEALSQQDASTQTFVDMEEQNIKDSAAPKQPTVEVTPDPKAAVNRDQMLPPISLVSCNTLFGSKSISHDDSENEVDSNVQLHLTIPVIPIDFLTPFLEHHRDVVLALIDVYEHLLQIKLALEKQTVTSQKPTDDKAFIKKFIAAVGSLPNLPINLMPAKVANKGEHIEVGSKYIFKKQMLRLIGATWENIKQFEQLPWADYEGFEQIKTRVALVTSFCGQH